MLTRFCPDCLEAIPDGQLKPTETTCQTCIERTDNKDLRCTDSDEYQHFQAHYNNSFISNFLQNSPPEKQEIIKKLIREKIEEVSFCPSEIQSLNDIKLPEGFSWQGNAETTDESRPFSSTLPTLVYRPTKYLELASTLFTLFVVLVCCYFFVYQNINSIMFAYNNHDYFTSDIIITAVLLLLLLNVLRRILVIILTKHTCIWLEIASNELTIKTGRNYKTAKALTIPRSSDVSIKTELNRSSTRTSLSVSSDGQTHIIAKRLELHQAKGIASILTLLTNFNIN